ncbi:MAG: 30S ribosome-binding factor RbfA [Pseudomonadota bacterium]
MHKHLPYDRSERVADAIFRVVAEASGELIDPRLAGARITRVSITKDLRIARICFHVADASKRDLAKKGFDSAKGFLKRRIGEDVKLKFMPELEFFYDEGVDTGERIDELLISVAGK